MGIRKRKQKEEPAPEPEPVKVPSRGVLLNKWAARQDKLQKLVAEVANVKAELVGIAAALHTHYGVLVTDTTHTVTLPKKAAAPAAQVPVEATAEGAEATVEGAPAAPEGTTPDDEGRPVKLLKPEENPLAKSPMPIIGEPVSGPMTEREVAKIRQDSVVEKGASETGMAQEMAGRMERAVRLGLGKK